MILSFEYEDLDWGWRLERVELDAVNLLVGPSGAGKTKILEALRSVRKAALVGLLGLPSARWSLEVEADGTVFSWRAESRVTFDRSTVGAFSKTEENGAESDAHFVSEEIRRGDELLVSRGQDFYFRGEKLPRLDVKTSAIELLSEDELHPLHRALQHLRAPRTEFTLLTGALGSVESAEADRRRLAGDLEALKHEQGFSIPWKLYILQQDHRELFERIVGDFRAVFPTVQALYVATWEQLGFRPRLDEGFMATMLALGMKEEGVPGWVFHQDFSSGMEKTLNLIVESTLAPAGTVFLLDELENGLGVNCLPDVAELMLRGLDRIQFIATSHHPQVINGIPTQYWKLVTRRGANVSVLDASSIEALQSASPLEKFTQLLNLPEYEEGVA